MTKVTQLNIDENGGATRRRIHLREISGDVDAPLETIGQDLRAARLRRGDDLASVSRALKIRKDYLDALEEDRLEALPGRTYAIGFVRTYAEYLGLDPNACVDRFKSEIAGRATDHPAPVMLVDEERKPLPRGWKLGVAVLGLIVVYAIWHLAAPGEPATAPVAAVPEQMVRPVAPAPVEQAPVAPPTDTAMTATPADPAQNAATPGQSGEATAPATNTANANAANPAASVGPAVPAVPATPLPKGRAYGAQNHNARVVLRARTETRIMVRSNDGRTFINRVLQPGDTYQVPNLVGLVLTSPDTSAVEVDLDGAPMGALGNRSGAAEEITLDPQAIVDRLNGRRAG